MDSTIGFGSLSHTQCIVLPPPQTCISLKSDQGKVAFLDRTSGARTGDQNGKDRISIRHTPRIVRFEDELVVKTWL